MVIQPESSAAPMDSARGDLPHVGTDSQLTAVWDALISGAPEHSPPGTSQQLSRILAYIRAMQEHLDELGHGYPDAPVALEGHTGELLTRMQNNIEQVAAIGRCMGAGDFTRKAEGSGVISSTINTMGESLQTAYIRLNEQNAEIDDMTNSLRHERESRIAIEASLRREQLRLEKLASTDFLTGIANRRHALFLAMREVERARRSCKPICLALLDIDYFKEVNDSLGHTAGDKALTTIADLVSGTVRPYDIVGRYGGDEFIILFPETSLDTSRTILERLRLAVDAKQISAGEGNHTVTLSIGLTQLDLDKPGTAPLDEAVLRADEALYNAKHKSRNITCIV